MACRNPRICARAPGADAALGGAGGPAARRGIGRSLGAVRSTASLRGRQPGRGRPPFSFAQPRENTSPPPVPSACAGTHRRAALSPASRTAPTWTGAGSRRAPAATELDAWANQRGCNTEAGGGASPGELLVKVKSPENVWPVDGGKHWQVLRRFDWSSGQGQSDHHSHPYEVLKTIGALFGNSRGVSCAFTLKPGSVLRRVFATCFNEETPEAMLGIGGCLAASGARSNTCKHLLDLHHSHLYEVVRTLGA